MIGFLSCFFLLLRLAFPAAPDALSAPGAPLHAPERLALHGDAGTPYGHRGGELSPEEIAGSAAGRTLADTGQIPSRIDFGDGAVGFRKDTVITVMTDDTNRLNPALQVREPFGLAASLQGRDTLSYIIHAFYAPVTIGDHSDSMEIGPGVINRAILLHGRAESGLLPFGGDSIVDMGDISVQGSRDTTSHIGLGDLELLRIDTIGFEENGAFQCLHPQIFPVTLSPANGRLDSITVRAVGGIAGRDSGTLVIRTNMGVRKIRFAARFTDTSSGVDTGEVYLNYNSDTLDFGEAEIAGGSAVRLLTVVNTTTSPVAIDTILRNDRDAFSVENFGGGASIPARDSVSLRIIFAPLAAGLHQGSLSVSGGGMRRTVQLFGTGIRKPQRGPDSVFVGEVEMGSADSCIDTTVVIVMRDSLRWTEIISDNPEFAILTSPVLPSPPADTLRVTVRFCWENSSGIGLAAGDIFLVAEGGARTHLLRVTARVLPRRSEPRGRIVLLGDTVIRFNQVNIGVCADQQILLMNTGDAPARLDSISFDGSRGAFTLIDAPALPLTLAPGERLNITVRFCPTEIGDVAGVWRGWQEGRTDTALAVALLGYGREVDLPKETVLLLGDTSVRVGVPFRLPLSLAGTVPPNTTLDYVRLVFNRRSLWFRNAFTAGGATLPKEFENDSTLLITGDGSTIGSKILDLEFIGLSSGQPINSVRVDGIALKTITTVRLDTAEVILIGCNLVDAGGFTKKISIKAIALDPLSSSVGISYDAPQGAVPLLGLIDLSGARVMQRELPHGNGIEQQAQIQLGELSPGLYLLELRVGNDRSTVPIMVRGR